MNTLITPTLDRIEESLPTCPRNIFRLQRSTAQAGYQIVRSGFELVAGALRPIERQATTSAKTTTGQARSALERTVTTARKGVAEVAGQAKAQSAKTLEAMETAAEDAIERATDVAEAVTGATLDELTKEDLYERAKLAEIPGRSSMSKDELVAALVS